jgi:hypothetical protein
MPEATRTIEWNVLRKTHLTVDYGASLADLRSNLQAQTTRLQARTSGHVGKQWFIPYSPWNPLGTPRSSGIAHYEIEFLRPKTRAKKLFIEDLLCDFGKEAEPVDELTFLALLAQESACFEKEDVWYALNATYHNPETGRRYILTAKRRNGMLCLGNQGSNDTFLSHGVFPHVIHNNTCAMCDRTLEQS